MHTIPKLFKHTPRVLLLSKTEQPKSSFHEVLTENYDSKSIFYPVYMYLMRDRIARTRNVTKGLQKLVIITSLVLFSALQSIHRQRRQHNITYTCQ